MGWESGRIVCPADRSKWATLGASLMRVDIPIGARNLNFFSDSANVASKSQQPTQLLAAFLSVSSGPSLLFCLISKNTFFNSDPFLASLDCSYPITGMFFTPELLAKRDSGFGLLWWGTFIMYLNDTLIQQQAGSDPWLEINIQETS